MIRDRHPRHKDVRLKAAAEQREHASDAMNSESNVMRVSAVSRVHDVKTNKNPIVNLSNLVVDSISASMSNDGTQVMKPRELLQRLPPRMDLSQHMTLTRR